MTTPIYSLGEFLQASFREIESIVPWIHPKQKNRLLGLKITLRDGSAHYYNRDGVTAEDPMYMNSYAPAHLRSEEDEPFGEREQQR